MERMKSEIVNRRSAALRYDQTFHTKSGKMAVEKSARNASKSNFCASLSVTATHTLCSDGA